MSDYLRLVFRLAPKTPAKSHRSVARSLGSDRLATPAPLIRRVLGKSLVESFCTFGKPHCQPSAPTSKAPSELCSLAGACPYGVLYAASRSRRPPFALHVPDNRDGVLDTIEWTLFGPACGLYAWACVALQRALWDGLGRDRLSFQILEVQRLQGDGHLTRLCGTDLSRLPPALTLDRLDFSAPEPNESRPLAIDFLSPTRLVKDKKMVWGSDPVPFDLLIARILSRITDIFGKDSPGVPGPDLQSEILRKASTVEILEDQTEWREVHDYSARSRSDLLLGGKTGRLLYSPSGWALLPILRAGEILSVGKNTASGCGRIQIREAT